MNHSQLSHPGFLGSRGRVLAFVCLLAASGAHGQTDAGTTNATKGGFWNKAGKITGGFLTNVIKEVRERVDPTIQIRKQLKDLEKGLGEIFPSERGTWDVEHTTDQGPTNYVIKILKSDAFLVRTSERKKSSKAQATAPTALPWQFPGHTQAKDNVKTVTLPPIDWATLSNCAPKDRVLHQYRLGLACLRRGDLTNAIGLLESATDATNQRLQGAGPRETGAGIIGAGESEKTFIGEPYERAFANVYLGFAYMQQQKPELAMACFKRAEELDSWGAKDQSQQYQSDLILPFFYRGMLLGGEEGQGHYQAITNIPHVNAVPPRYEPNHNVVLLMDHGTGPRKYVAGTAKEELHFEDGITSISDIRVTVPGIAPVTLRSHDDTTFQAITRGGRVMDHVNKAKKNVKKTAKVVGWSLILAGAGVLIPGGNEIVAAGLMIGGVALLATQEYIEPEADARYWDNLPACLSALSLSLPEGTHKIKVEFLDRNTNPTRTLEAEVSVKPGRSEALYFSELQTTGDATSLANR